MRIAAPIVCVLAWLVAGAAPAAPSASLVWSGNTGGGPLGTSTTTAAAGDTLTLDVVIHMDATGLSGWEFYLSAFGATPLSGTECPGGGASTYGTSANVGPDGTCFTSLLEPIGALLPGVDLVGSNVGDPDGNQFDAGIVPGIAYAGQLPLFVGRAVFVASGPMLVELFGTAVDASFVTHSIYANTVPEPGTAGLLGLGLVGLALGGRRRR